MGDPALSLTFTGVSFVMDSIMPVETGSLGEDTVRGVTAVLLVNTVLGSMPEIGKDVGPFATWLIARRFSNMLKVIDILQSTAIIGVILGIVKTIHGWIGGAVVGIMQDLFVLVAVFLTSAWVMHSTDRGNTGDALVLMISIMMVARVVMTTFIT